MNIELFSTLLRNLLQVNVIHINKNTDSSKTLQAFEEKFCFHETMQPMFTAQAINYYTEYMKENTYYEIIDSLDMCLLFFDFKDETFYLGPYVKSEYDEKKLQELLAKNSLPASYTIPLKLYYTAFPLLSTYHIQTTITACIRSFDPVLPEYTYRRLQGFHKELSMETLDSPDIYDYSELYRRYDVENHFIKMIENGDEREVEIAFQDVISSSGNVENYTTNAIRQNPMTGLSILRTLARKAAERSGLSVVTIDEITQKAVQLMTASQNYRDQGMYTRNMILELTRAVHDQQIANTGYSPAIRRILEYMELHYSQEFSLTTLAEYMDRSPSYISKIFKQETGTTLVNHLAGIRCRHAVQMLKDTDLSIQEISSYIGYMDNNYFVKVFKKQFGLTPSEYRSKKTQ